MPGIFALLAAAAAGVGFGAGTLYQSRRIRSMSQEEFHMWVASPHINRIVLGAVLGEMMNWYVINTTPSEPPK